MRRFASLAWLLLLTAGAMLSACPLPQYEIEPNGLTIDESLVAPPLGLTTAARQCAASTVSFDVSAAVDDPEGDDVLVFWYVNYDPALPTLHRKVGSPIEAFDLDVCDASVAPTEDRVLVEAVIMDRTPPVFDAERPRLPTGDGNLRILYWVVEISEGNACCGI